MSVKVLDSFKLNGKKINFILDDYVIIYFIIKYSKNNIDILSNELINLQNELYNNEYIFNNVFNLDIEDIHNSNFTESVKNFFQLFKENSIYKKIKNDLLDNYELVKKEFNINLDKINNFLKKIIKSEFKNNSKIYLLPYELNVSFEKNGNIYYGCNYKYPEIITIIHEILHVELGKGEVEHAIIELITNGELYKNIYKIKDKNIYFDGHWFLSDIKYEIYLDWIEYLKLDKYDNLNDFIVYLYNKLNKNGYFFTIPPRYENNKYVNLNNRVILINGIKKGLLVDDNTKTVYHICEKIKNFLNDYCYSERIFNENLIENKLKKEINKLLTNNIISIDNFKVNNKKFTEYRYKHIEISSITIEITNYCNYHCKHCYSKKRNIKLDLKNELNKNSKIEMFDFELYKRILFELKKYGLEAVHIAGGEPLLVNDYVLYNYISEAYKYTNINAIFLFTNCSKLTENYIENLKNYNKKLIIGITIHSNCELENDSISGVKGDFINKIKIISLLKKHNIKYIIYSVISENNINKFNDLIEFLECLKEKQQKRKPYSFARIADNNLNFDYSKHKELILKNPYEIFNEAIINPKDLLSNRKYHPCFSRHLSLDVNGNIYGCSELHSDDTKIGNIAHYINNISSEFKYLCFFCHDQIKNINKYKLETFCKYDPKSGRIKGK